MWSDRLLEKKWLYLRIILKNRRRVKLQKGEKRIGAEDERQ